MQLGLQAAESSATRSSSKLSTLEPERNLPGDPLSAELGAEDLTPADTRVTEAARRAAPKAASRFSDFSCDVAQRGARSFPWVQDPKSPLRKHAAVFQGRCGASPLTIRYHRHKTCVITKHTLDTTAREALLYVMAFLHT